MTDGPDEVVRRLRPATTPLARLRRFRDRHPASPHDDVSRETVHPGLDLAIDFLAAYRVTRLLVQDSILDVPRYQIQKLHPKLDELLDCPHCTGVWVAAAVTAARYWWPHLWDQPARFLAAAGAVSVIADHLSTPPTE